LEGDWKKLGKTVKADFMLKARGMTGTDMEMHMETTIKDECKQKTDRAFEGKGDWLGEVDAKEKFKATPEQGDAVIKNAEQFYDTEREVILYRLNNYTSTDKAAESRGKVVTRKASSTDIAKKPKKQKGEGEGRGAAEGATIVKDDRPVLLKSPVTAPQEKQLQKMKEKKQQHGGEPQDALKQL